ncbi:MAG: hypothetical protein KAT58_12260, partial [candidate division Zixibacteria bacterium]|nr:hypothetical protein [candidate division Zixibacteria bacterium]
MNEDHRLNRVLLESGLFARRYRTGSGCEGVVVDGSCVPFLIEEFVSLAATEIVIPSSAFEAAFVGRLPEKLQRRVKVVDVTDTEKQRIAIAQPLAEEFGVEIVPMGLYYAKHVPEDIAAALGGLYFALDHFLIGLRYQVQIDINLQHLRESVNKLLGVSRNPQARANLAILAGILRTYNSLPFDSFELRAQPADRLLGLFEEFLADETYRHISNNCYMLGFPERFQRARDMLSRLTRQLVRKPLFKPLLTLASR